MPNPRKNLQPVIKKLPVHKTLPWSCIQFGNLSEIDVRIVAAGEKESIADVHSVADIHAKDIGEYIVQAVNHQERLRDTIAHLVSILDLCLACDGKLTWEAEQEADVLCEKVKQGII